MTILFTEPSFVPVSGNSVVYPGAKLYFYATETSTPQNTYSEYTLTTAHANPVVADADGRFAPIYLDPSLADYKVVLKDSSDVTIWTVDPYSAINNTTRLGTMSDLLSASTALGTVSINGYHTAGDGGGGTFYWDASQDKANHNGGTIIDPDIAFPDWTNATQVATWFTAGTGTGCWMRVVDGSINVEWFGAIPSLSAVGNTKAIQSMIDTVGYFRLLKGTYNINDSLLVRIATQYGTIWSGEGMEVSVLNCTGMTGKAAIKPESIVGSLLRPNMRDFKITGDCDTCIDLETDANGVLFQSEFRNLNLSSAADSAFKANTLFSTGFYNVHVSSLGGHGFELGGGSNSTVLVNCYAHLIGDGLSTGKAGYRIAGQAVLVGCNGLDGGDYWGHFGDAATPVQFRIAIVGGNAEDFDINAIKTEYTGELILDQVNMIGPQNIANGGNANTFESFVHIGSSTGSVVFERKGGFWTTKTATMDAPTDIISDVNQTRIAIDDRSTTTPTYNVGWVSGGASGTTYAAATSGQTSATTEFGVRAQKFNLIDCVRNYGFSQQVTATWTANTSTFDITKKTIVQTANTVATNLTNATGGIDGQELTLLIKDANTVIKHSIGGAGRFINSSAADITTSDGDVYKYVWNDSVWKQI